MMKPFSMVLEGVADSDMTETEYIDLCDKIKESIEFGIPYPNRILEMRQFHKPGTDFPEKYTNTFAFHIIFPNHRGTKSANATFVADKMANLLEVLLEDVLPVGMEGKYSEKKTFMVIKCSHV